MCTKTALLVILFIFKILVLIIPFIIFILKRTSALFKIIKYLYISEVVLLIFLILLSVLKSDCIKNSTFNGIKLNSKIFSDIKSVKEETTIIDYKNINPTKVYKNNVNMDVNYYNINYYPLKDIKINCEKKSYFKNYGNDIAALSTAITTITGNVVNPYDILEYAQKAGLLTCDKIPTSEELINSITSLYGINAYKITSNEIMSNLNSGKIVLAKTKVNDNNINLSCNEKLVVIYYFNSKGEFSIINPSDTLYDYFCSNNTPGYGSIIKGNQNKKTFNKEELDNYIIDYYLLGVE